MCSAVKRFYLKHRYVTLEIIYVYYKNEFIKAYNKNISHNLERCFTGEEPNGEASIVMPSVLLS